MARCGADSGIAWRANGTPSRARHIGVALGDDAFADHARQHLVAALGGADGVAVGALLDRRLRQRDQQRGFGEIDLRDGSLPK